jgi:hypothetical protein
VKAYLTASPKTSEDIFTAVRKKLGMIPDSEAAAPAKQAPTKQAEQASPKKASKS